MAREDDLFAIGLDLDCVPTRLHALLGINPKSWYDLIEQGVLPKSGTYRDYLLPLFTHYKKQNEVALEKVKLKADEKVEKKAAKSESYDKLFEAQMLQKIRLDQAKEEQLHLNNLKDKNEVLVKAELMELISPMLGNIAGILRAAAEEEPKLQSTIDKTFESLYKLSEILAWQVDQDKKSYVKDMLQRPVDLEKLFSDTELPSQ